MNEGKSVQTLMQEIKLPPALDVGESYGKLTWSIICVLITAAVLALATQIRTSIDLTEDRRNSFSAADQRAHNLS